MNFVFEAREGHLKQTILRQYTDETLEFSVK